MYTIMVAPFELTLQQIDMLTMYSQWFWKISPSVSYGTLQKLMPLTLEDPTQQVLWESYQSSMRR